MNRIYFIIGFFLVVSCNKDNPETIQNHLTGTWVGQGTSELMPEETWQATIEIEKNGHYTAAVTSGEEFSFFYMGFDWMDHKERKFVITSVDAFGEGHGYANVLTGENHYLPVQINYIKFSDRNNHLNFRAYSYLNYVYINYSLDKVK